MVTAIKSSNSLKMLAQTLVSLRQILSISGQLRRRKYDFQVGVL